MSSKSTFWHLKITGEKLIYLYIQIDNVLNLLLHLKEIRGWYYHNYCKYIEMVKADLEKIRALNNKQKKTVR